VKNSINIIKRSIVVNGRKTSVSLEQEFWESFREIANLQNTKLSTLVQHINETRGGNNLSSAIRVFVHNHLRAQTRQRTSLSATDYRPLQIIGG